MALEFCHELGIANRDIKLENLLLDVLVKCIPPCSVLLCKTGSQLACVTAITLLETCSKYMCAVSQQRCTAAMVKAK